MYSNIQYLACFTIVLLALTTAVSSVQAQCTNPAPGKELVGAWRGTSGEGNPIILTANSDGLISSSVVSEVSLSLRPNVLTPGQGVWQHVGGRQFELTGYGLLYSITRGSYQGYLKARLRLTVSPDCLSMTGSDKVEIYDSSDNLIFAVPEGQTSYVRTLPQPFE